jgi:hypothetical protein
MLMAVPTRRPLSHAQPRRRHRALPITILQNWMSDLKKSVSP